MKLRLYDWGPSPFCLKVRAVLDHKRLEYERVNVLGPAWITLRQRGGIGKVPGLEVDGKLTVDSTDILQLLDQLAPDPPLVPPDARGKALCHVLEDWADESLYFTGIYYQWVEPAGAARVPEAFARFPLGDVVRRAYDRRIRNQLRGQGTGRKSPEHVHRDMVRHLEHVENLLWGGDFLLGSGPWSCDFAVAAQLVYLGRTPVGGAAMKAYPRTAAYLDRMRALRR